jgi:hypothetical protein
MLEHFDARRFCHARDQRTGDFCSSLIAMRVNDPFPGMRGLLAECKASARVHIEARAGGGQIAHARRSLGNEHFDGCGIAQRGSCGEGIDPVELWRIACPPALRRFLPARMRWHCRTAIVSSAQ